MIIDEGVSSIYIKCVVYDPLLNKIWDQKGIKQNVIFRSRSCYFTEEVGMLLGVYIGWRNHDEKYVSYYYNIKHSESYGGKDSEDFNKNKTNNIAYLIDFFNKYDGEIIGYDLVYMLEWLSERIAIENDFKKNKLIDIGVIYNILSPAHANSKTIIDFSYIVKKLTGTDVKSFSHIEWYKNVVDKYADVVENIFVIPYEIMRDSVFAEMELLFNCHIALQKLHKDIIANNKVPDVTKLNDLLKTEIDVTKALFYMHKNGVLIDYKAAQLADEYYEEKTYHIKKKIKYMQTYIDMLDNILFALEKKFFDDNSNKIVLTDKNLSMQDFFNFMVSRKNITTLKKLLTEKSYIDLFKDMQEIRKIYNGILNKKAEGFNVDSNEDKQQLILSLCSKKPIMRNNEISGYNLQRDNKTIFVPATKTGNIQLDKDSLPVILTIVPELEDILVYSAIEKRRIDFLGKYISMARYSQDKKIHPCFVQIGTVTGRMSCINPNLQQVPKKSKLSHAVDLLSDSCRGILSAEDGYLLGSIDYKGMEIAILIAIASGDGADVIRKEYADAIKNNIDFDFHKKTAYAIMPQDKIEDENSVGVWRDIAKQVNFGAIYGIGVEKLSKILSMPEEQTREIRNNFFNNMPFINETKNVICTPNERNIKESQKRLPKNSPFLKSIGYQIHKDNENEYYVYQNPTGRIIQYKTYNDKNEKIFDGKDYRLLNYMIQSVGADILKKALANALNAGLFEKLKFQLCIHDEIICSIPKTEEGINAFIELKNIMENVVDWDTKMQCSASIACNWMLTDSYEKEEDIRKRFKECSL